MQEIRVNLKKTQDNSYDIVIDEGLLESIPERISNAGLGHKFAIITDSNVEPLYAKDLSKALSDKGLYNKIITIQAGEQSKNRDVKAWIEDQMLKDKFARDSAVIALGGGVVGDIAGYVAASYTRGLPYVQIPTTLVACVDSSIGGKTAVDTEYGKNLIGAFYQPWAVLIDVNTLLTLTEKEIREGLAEVIKYGVIKDPELFSFLEEKMETVFSYDKDSLTYIIRTGCVIKGYVVENDEKESNLRKILNFGHTIGHAVENLSNYEISHGEAISIGMVAEGKLAVEMGIWNEGELTKMIELIEQAGLPTQIPQNMSAEQIIDAMKLDKKARGGNIEMVLPDKIGNMAIQNEGYGIKIDDEVIRSVI